MNDDIKGLIRTGVQYVVASLLAWGPIQAVLEGLTLEISYTQAVTWLTWLVLLVYWAIGSQLQKLPQVQENTALRWVVGVLMGGMERPEYDPDEE